MSQENIAYFIATGPVKNAIVAYFAAKDAHVAYMQVIADELGMPNMHAMGDDIPRVIGFSGGKTPAYMKSIDRSVRNSHVMVPRKRDPAGKALLARMSAAPRVLHIDTILQAAGLDTGFYISEGMGHIHTCGLATFGDTIIFSLRTDSAGKVLAGEPKHYERIPTSRYWQFVEEAEAAAKAKKESTS